MPELHSTTLSSSCWRVCACVSFRRTLCVLCFTLFDIDRDCISEKELNWLAILGALIPIVCPPIYAPSRRLPSHVLHLKALSLSSSESVSAVVGSTSGIWQYIRV